MSDNIFCDICNSKLSRKKDLPRHKRSEYCLKINELMTKFNNDKNIKKDLLEEEVKILQDRVIILEKENMMNKEKAEEYRKIIENTNSKFKIKKENDTLNTTFQIDINLDHKQLNKTKFKDVSEEVAKDIQTLKLKDNYQLEYREEHGFINITDLCKAGGKKFNDWNRLDKTKKYLQVLSTETGIPVSGLINIGSGSKTLNDTKNLTWAHPQVSINIAQWISAEFDVLVSKWVYEIMLTGKVDIKNNKTTQELDIMNKENKLLKNRIKLLESKTLQKQPRESFEENKNVIYIVTTEFKEAQGHYKIGKAQDLQKRMSVYNTSEKHEVIYNTSCKNKKSMDLLEQLVHMNLEEKRVEPNKEWFESEEDDAQDLIKVIENIKKINNL
jgi:hypothetical protein